MKGYFIIYDSVSDNNSDVIYSDIYVSKESVQESFNILRDTIITDPNTWESEAINSFDCNERYEIINEENTFVIYEKDRYDEKHTYIEIIERTIHN